MPFKLSSEKPPLSNLRERLIFDRLAQVETKLAEKEDELQVNLRYGLSPAKLDQSQFELDALRDLKRNLTHGLETVAQQSVGNGPAFARDEEEDSPIGPWRKRGAYLDQLQRERNKISPLSREQFVQAKEISAKRSSRRRGVDVNSDDVLRRQHPTWYSTPSSYPGSVPSYMYAMQTLTGYDPCLDAKKVRREVMFAQRTAGIGYRTRHQWKPC
jgi:hypothetical protein